MHHRWHGIRRRSSACKLRNGELSSLLLTSKLLSDSSQVLPGNLQLSSTSLASCFHSPLSFLCASLGSSLVVHACLDASL